MQSCCLVGCESYKYVTKQKIGYFKFPLHNQQLLQKWLNQIRIPDWIPTDAHQICSTHFHIDDIDFTPRFPVLKDNAIPMIFPLKHFQYIYVNDSYLSSVTNTNIRQATEKKALNNVKYPTNISSTTSNFPSVVFGVPKQKLIAPIIKKSTSIPTNQLMKPVKIVNPNVSALNPYIFVVSTFDEQKLQSPLINTTKRIIQPILKIEIDKKVHKTSKYHKNLSSDNNYSQINKIHKKDLATGKVTDTFIEEVEIEDVSASKVVVFKLNRSTGEIKVLKREKPKINNIDSKIFVAPESTQSSIKIFHANKRKLYKTEHSLKKRIYIQSSINKNTREVVGGIKIEKNIPNTNSDEKKDFQMHSCRKIPILRKTSRKNV